MLLRQLVEYAERLECKEGSTQLPRHHQQRPIRWIVNIDQDGQFLGFSRTTNGLEGKREGPKSFVAPNVNRAGDNFEAKLLADNGEYALGVARSKTDPKVKLRHAAFVAAVAACANASGLPEVRAVEKFLDGLHLGEIALPENFDPAENLTFAVDGQLLIDLPAVRNYWISAMDRKTEEGAFQAECLISGEYGPVVERELVKIKGIPGGQPSGMALISANEEAFESYGLHASHVAPVRAEYAEKYANALNRLLRDNHTHLRIGPIAYAFWTKEGPLPPVVEAITSPDLENPQLAALLRGESVDLRVGERPEQAKKMLESPWKGRMFESIRDNAFYAVGLSSSGGRVVVRDHLTTTVARVKTSLQEYFASQNLVDWNGKPGSPLGVSALAFSLYRKPQNEMVASVPVALLQFALSKKPLPLAFLAQVVSRNRAERKVARPRAMLSKMVLISRGKEMNAMDKLNVDRSEVSYHLGRLLAIVDGIQRTALGNVKAGVVDRFYGSASTTPAWVFGRLMSGAMSHMGKLRKSQMPAYVACDKRLQEVMQRIEEFPKVLRVEDQALFSLGYFHERAHRWGEIIAHATKHQHPSESERGGDTDIENQGGTK